MHIIPCNPKPQKKVILSLISNMYGCSNTLIGFINLLTLLASIPIIGAGLWLTRSTSTITCDGFLRTPLLVIGFIILIVSLVGLIGACFHVVWALWLYLAVMLLLIAVLIGITIFGFVITAPGGGHPVSGRAYPEYHLEDYSSWLRKRVQDSRYWTTVKACIVGSRSCEKIVLWTPSDYLTRDMTPIQSGCCKPPTSCNYAMTEPQEQDCYNWNNAETSLCYDCESCKAGVLEDVRRSWRKVSMLNIIMVVVLIGIYSIGCCAFQNVNRAYGLNWISKVRPYWDYHW